MGPEALAQVLRPLAGIFAVADYPDLLQGIDTPDDAAVWRLDDERALVLTADFFPPVVDDPFQFGAIAAANALSDLYAMGADPLIAINLVGYPDDLDRGILSEILRGGAEKVREAGAVVAGGHTTSDKEPKYGLAVTGLVHPSRILTKAGAQPGDRLLLTKPIGTGLVTTAHKKQTVEEEYLAIAMASMARLHRGVHSILGEHDGAVHAATDITGFALAGHAHEMAHQSGVSLRMEWDSLPLLPGAEEYARRGYAPGGGRRNEEFYGPWVRYHRRLDDWQRTLLFDPQTSGGLFLSVSPGRAAALEDALREANEPVWGIGEVLLGEAGRIEIA
jgi:selenide,water dikinase